MGRRNKVGLDFFPLDVDTDSNMKLALIEAEYGSKGFTIWIKMLQRIYGGKGYYIDWNDDTKLILAKAFGEPGSLVGEVIMACIRRGLFNKSVFDAYQILTSDSIQSTYLGIVDRRDKVEITTEFTLIDINEYKNVINVDINKDDTNINTQSKVKKIKVNESKEIPPEGVFDFEKKLIEFGFEKKLVTEWLVIRKKKKAINSETAFNRFINEIEKCQKPINEILEYIVSKSWQGFEASWLNNNLSNYGNNKNTRALIEHHTDFGEL